MADKILSKKSLGQNFLVDHNIARKIVALLDIKSEDYIIEVGPGTGILTQFFFDLKNNLTAVELDQRCVELLKRKCEKHANVEIVHGDFVKLDLERLKINAKQEKWIGNLPYNITSSVLFKMLDSYPRVKRAVFMVQKEVGERIVASKGNKSYGILSVLMQSFYQSRLHFKVSNRVFRPQPKVASAVISFELRTDSRIECPMPDYQELIKKAFNQRRKLLRNSLQSMISKEDRKRIPFEFNRRAEEVSVEEWKSLSRHLPQKMMHI